MTSKRIRIVIWSLVFSTVVFVIGLVAWLLMESAVEAPGPGGGAPFISLGWIAIGPAVSYVLVPVSYYLVRNRREMARYFAIPAGLVVVTFLAALAGSGFDPTGTDVFALAIHSVGLILGWVAYVWGMDGARFRIDMRDLTSGDR
jgi:hypothetical protein